MKTYEVTRSIPMTWFQVARFEAASEEEALKTVKECPELFEDFDALNTELHKDVEWQDYEVSAI